MQGTKSGKNMEEKTKKKKKKTSLVHFVLGFYE